MRSSIKAAQMDSYNAAREGRAMNMDADSTRPAMTRMSMTQVDMGLPAPSPHAHLGPETNQSQDSVFAESELDDAPEGVRGGSLEQERRSNKAIQRLEREFIQHKAHIHRSFEKFDAAAQEDEESRTKLQKTVEILSAKQQDLFAKQEEQAARANAIRDELQVDLNMKLEKVASPLQSVQEILYKSAGVEESINELEERISARFEQFDRHVNQLFQNLHAVSNENANQLNDLARRHETPEEREVQVNYGGLEDSSDFAQWREAVEQRVRYAEQRLTAVEDVCRSNYETVGRMSQPLLQISSEADRAIDQPLQQIPREANRVIDQPLQQIPREADRVIERVQLIERVQQVPVEDDRMREVLQQRLYESEELLAEAEHGKKTIAVELNALVQKKLLDLEGAVLEHQMLLANGGLVPTRLFKLEMLVKELAQGVDRDQGLWHAPLLDKGGYAQLSSQGLRSNSPRGVSAADVENVEGIEDIDGQSAKLCGDLPQDNWGIFILWACKEVPDISVHCECSSSILMMTAPFTGFLGLVLQIICIFAVEAPHHERSLHCSGTQRLFVAALATPHFFCVVLWLWMLSIIHEVNKCFALLANLWTCPYVRRLADMTEVKGDDQYGDLYGIRIVGLTTCVRGALMFSTVVPRLALITWLAWTGCQWLFSTLHYIDVILRVLVLQFILNVDDILYKSCWPDSYKRKLQKSSVVRTADGETGQVFRKEVSTAIGLTTCLTCLCLVYVVSYYYIFQKEAPQAQRGCNLVT